MSSISGMERPRRREGVRNQRTRDPDPGHSKVRPLVTQPHVFRVAADRFTEAPGGQTLLITTDNVPWDLRGADARQVPSLLGPWTPPFTANFYLGAWVGGTCHR